MADETPDDVARRLLATAMVMRAARRMRERRGRGLRDGVRAFAACWLFLFGTCVLGSFVAWEFVWPDAPFLRMYLLLSVAVAVGFARLRAAPFPPRG